MIISEGKFSALQTALYFHAEKDGKVVNPVADDLMHMVEQATAN